MYLIFQLIQFLVTLVQPSTGTRMGVGVKRRMPLMLYESSSKKVRVVRNNIQDNIHTGPTIHELDNEIKTTSEELYEQDVDQQEEVCKEINVYCL